MPLILPNTIENDTAADATELQQNFSTIQTHVNTSLVNRDGSVAMTAPLLLSGDPTQANHAASKDYVDTLATNLIAWTPTITGLVKGNGTTVHSVQLKQGRQCTVAWGFRFGTSSTLLTNLRFTLPYTALTEGFNGGGYAYDASPTQAWPVLVQSNGFTECGVWWYGIPSGTERTSCDYFELGDPGWAVNDEIHFEMTYLTAA